MISRRQLVTCIAPMNSTINPYEIANNSGTFRNCISCVLVNPPGNEAGDPGIGVRVTGGPNVWAYATRRTVTAHHIDELCFREMCQFIETDERDLRALVTIHRVIAVKMIEGDLRAARKDDALRGRFQERRAQGPVNAFRIVPEAAFISNLAAVTPEDDDTELRVLDMPQGLEQQSVCLA